MRVLYDAAVLVNADRNDRATWLDHRRRLERGVLPVVTAPVVAQASRSVRQALLRRLLAQCEVVDFGAGDAHAVGELMARAGTSDVVDAHVVQVAAREESIVVTGDVRDLETLAAHVRATIVIEPA